MRIEKFLIRLFAEQEQKPFYDLYAPERSNFLNVVKVLHDGIYAFYEVPEVLLVDSAIRLDRFKILQPREVIPENSILIDILDIIFELPPPSHIMDVSSEEQNVSKAEPTQGVMLFPIYKML